MSKKDSMKSIWYIAKYDLNKIILNPKLYIVLILEFIYLWYLINPIVTLSKSVGIRVAPWLFTHITSNMYTQLFILLGAVALFADAPFIDDGYNFILVRSGKKKWILGQSVYILMTSFIYTFLIFLLTVILTIPNIFPSLNWGKLLTTIGNTTAGDGFTLTLDNKILLLYSPLKATLISFILECCVSTILGMIIFVINIKSKRSIGVIVSSAILLLDCAIESNFPDFICQYISPVSLARLSLLDNQGIGGAPTLAYSCIFLIIYIIVLGVLSIFIGKNRIFDSIN